MKSPYYVLVLLPLTIIAEPIEAASFFSLNARSPQSNPVSKDATCGSQSSVGATCLNSGHGNCCSQKGFCGSTSAYCQEGCQPDFGTCETSDGGQSVSTSGNCGVVDGFNLTCQGSEWGDCCSPLGFCGATLDYCGTGCQNNFGDCGSTGGQIEDATSRPSSTSSTRPRTTTTGQPTLISSATPNPSSPPSSGTSASVRPSDSGSSSASSGTSAALSSSVETSMSGFVNTKVIGLSEPALTGAVSTGTLGSVAEPASSASTPPLSANNESANLSTGAKAGIAVGVVALALIVAAIVAFFLHRRRKRRNGEAIELSGETRPLEKYSEPIMEFYDPKSTAKMEYKLGSYHEVDSKRDVPPVELAADPREAVRKEKERIARVDERAAAGYDGAYRGN